MNLWVLIPLLLVLAGLRFLRPNILIWLAAWWAGFFVLIRFAIDPPLPSSIIGLFMAILTAALILYGTSDGEKLRTIRGSLKAFLTERRFSPLLGFALIAIPLLIGFKAYRASTREAAAPASGRTIHPAPPAEIAFRGKKFDILRASNPFRVLESRDAAAFADHVADGRSVYYRNCVFCHGDNMEGDGIYAHGFDPQPANFADPTTIAMLQESYLFWRIAKGGPGLPDESAPWASAMPAWESRLQEDQIWDVILFLYSFTGRKPRAQERAE
jgi:mono/diheme cytochrome c family protein